MQFTFIAHSYYCQHNWCVWVCVRIWKIGLVGFLSIQFGFSFFGPHYAVDIQSGLQLFFLHCAVCVCARSFIHAHIIIIIIHTHDDSIHVTVCFVCTKNTQFWHFNVYLRMIICTIRISNHKVFACQAWSGIDHHHSENGKCSNQTNNAPNSFQNLNDK